MNLKEAFRFQNKLQSLMDEAERILADDRNITQVKVTALYKKAMPEQENETTVEPAPSEYADHIDAVAAFLLHLLGEREKLSPGHPRSQGAAGDGHGQRGEPEQHPPEPGVLLPPHGGPAQFGKAACPAGPRAIGSTRRGTRSPSGATPSGWSPSTMTATGSAAI